MPSSLPQSSQYIQASQYSQYQLPVAPNTSQFIPVPSSLCPNTPAPPGGALIAAPLSQSLSDPNKEVAALARFLYGLPPHLGGGRGGAAPPVT